MSNTTNATLRDYLSGKSLFGAILALEQFDFLANQEDVGAMDQLLIWNYGERVLFDKMQNVDLNIVAAMLIRQFGKGWDELSDFNATPWHLGVSEGHKISGKVIETTQTNAEDETTDKVSAFNTDGFVNDTGREEAHTKTVTGETQTDNLDEKYSLNEAVSNLTALQKLNIIQVAVKDVGDFLTLAVYQ